MSLAQGERAYMNGDDDLRQPSAMRDASEESEESEKSEKSETPSDAAGEPSNDDDQEITLTFSYDPQATLEELFGISEETLFQAFDLALARVGVRESVEVSVLISTDDGIRTLNREYRGKDEPTDVLSFPLLDHPLVDAPADQLWQTPDDMTGELDEADEAGDDTDAPLPEDEEDFADDEDDGDLKGMIVLLGDGEDEDDFDDGSDQWPTHLGDIAISRETALQQARQAGHSAAYEVAFLFIHGVLHLVGFDDHTDAGYQAMVAHQEAALAQAGVTR